MKRSARPTKSYRGCARCKAKKVKCDEAKPACQACVRAGVECPGFEPQYKWSRKHEAFDRPFNRPRRLSKRGENRISEQGSGNELDIVEGTPTSATSNVSQEFQMPADVTSPTEVTTWNNLMLMSLGFSDFTDLEPEQFDNLRTYSNNGDYSSTLNMPLSTSAAPSQAWTFPGFSTNSLFSSTTDQRENMGTLPNTNNRNQTTSALSDSNATLNSSIVAEQTSSARRKDSNTTKASLLGAFYRLTSPSTNPHFSEEHLVRYYFDTICSLYSCFDSSLNPFRHMVADLLSKSNTIYLSIQSMAITHLANHYLYMAPLSRAKRSQAWKSLQLDFRLHRAGKAPLEQVLLSLLLLGLSSTWYQPSNLGLQYLTIARNLMQVYLEGRRSERPCNQLPDETFFLNALMHWEMLASFIDPVPMMPFPGNGSPALHQAVQEEQIIPHPWTGIVPELHFALAEIGRILRRGQRLTAHQEHGNKAWGEEDREWATSLESFLSSILIPGIDKIRDYGDKTTPKSDLIRSADAYRYVGLLEIYHAFPSILENKLSQEVVFPAVYDGPFDIMPSMSQANDHESWLCAIAIRTLDLVKHTYLSSAACRSQALVLVSCAAQLRIPNTSNSQEDNQDSTLDEVLDARFFVEGRLLALSRKYSHSQMMHILNIVKEVWQRQDEGDQAVHWVDVIHEDGWQTLLG